MYPKTITSEQFLEYTEPAVKSLFTSIGNEIIRYSSLKESLEKKHAFFHQDFASADIHEDFDEVRVQHMFSRAMKAKIESLLISQSIEVLCGSVYQIAKQGISLILPEQDRDSRGKEIGSQFLSNIIWNGRNQAMHWEEGTPKNKSTKECFETLEKEFGGQFQFTESPRNMAWELWKIINWASYEDYLSDLSIIFGSA